MKIVVRILFCALFSSIFIAPVSNAASDTTLLTICTSLRTDYQYISASGKCNERIYEKSTWYEPGMAPRGTLGSKTVSITLCTSKSRSNLRSLAKEGRSCNRASQTQSIFQRPLGPPAAPVQEIDEDEYTGTISWESIDGQLLVLAPHHSFDLRRRFLLG